MICWASRSSFDQLDEVVRRIQDCLADITETDAYGSAPPKIRDGIVDTQASHRCDLNRNGQLVPDLDWHRLRRPVWPDLFAWVEDEPARKNVAAHSRWVEQAGAKRDFSLQSL